VSKQIKKIMPSAQVEGNAKTPRSGAFEITIDGKLVYSKFQMGSFPKAADISSWFQP
jgi:selT/selW/selH-like putative selenoprotein